MELDKIMKDLIDLDAEMLAHETSISQIHQAVARREPVVSVS